MKMKRRKMEAAPPIELSERPASPQITVACLGLFTDAFTLCDFLRFFSIASNYFSILLPFRCSSLGLSL